MPSNYYYILLSVGWIVFCLFHSFFAALWVKEKIARWSGRYYVYYRLIYSVISLMFLIFLLLLQTGRKETILFSVSHVVRVITSFAIFGGLILMGISAVRYFIPVTGLSIFTAQETTDTLFEGGVHGMIRHPLYAGTLLVVWGVFLFFPFRGNLISTLIITGYTFIGIRLEEKKLLLQFGKIYEPHRSRVPMMIPKWRLRKSATHPIRVVKESAE